MSQFLQTEEGETEMYHDPTQLEFETAIKNCAIAVSLFQLRNFHLGGFLLGAELLSSFHLLCRRKLFKNKCS